MQKLVWLTNFIRTKLRYMQRCNPLILLCIFLFYACTEKIYKHKDVVKTFQTPTELIARMGEPSEIKTVGKQKEYIYFYILPSNKIPHKRLDINDPLSNHKKRTFMDSLGKATKYYDAYNTPQSIDENQFDKFEHWIKYTYSEDGKLIKTEQKGVDLSVRIHRPVNTAFVIILTTALIGVSAVALSGGPLVSIGSINLHW